MTQDISQQRLLDAWRECQRHRHFIDYALSSLQASLPITGERLTRLSDAEIQSLDQFVLRFGKLQDAIGTRLLPSVLLYLQEPYEDRPMLDKLHRLEKLGYIENSEQWQTLRILRNRFAHEYPDDPDKNAAILMLAIESVASLGSILERIDQKLALSSIA
ncbi:hypothetical protein KF947_14800 [Halomonas sp. FeN2]|uniref:Uncharacterized protein n=1 Tax=Vreelandella neptunia TaxID=115551 RepID=A0ABZ0YMS8_9GAMM|nr:MULTISPECIES: hypothetical protein [Halomonas]MDN3558462.1 hypothetical protein [Halomonas neptunia]UBR48611.1 hypothetical protein KF947_14800 [Halomonas sp. FeN2]WQH13435.1 hypothetical protein SR894_02565 [Halomonas neptunia]|tara:strand:+ start:375 stop:854 length:480 start_codon:yes stop_codon:yes gene_type:complete